jgi:putative endonuclease
VAPYYVYIVRCVDGTFYTGVTNDIERRYDEHCFGHDPTCYTFPRRPLRLAYAGEFQQIADAIAFEKRLRAGATRKSEYSRIAIGPCSSASPCAKGAERCPAFSRDGGPSTAHCVLRSG